LSLEAGKIRAMGFRETCAMEERIGMLRGYDTGAFTVGELVARHGVSRETFYVWKRRRESGEERWFEARSRAPGHCPHATGAGQAAIVATRKRFPRYGAKKIRAKLLEKRPGAGWPAASTIGDILKRQGLIAARERRRKPVARGEIVAGATAANEEWSIDFKGWFRMRNGERCDPLTIADTASRYLIEARIVEPTWAGVRMALERIFAAVGLPAATSRRPSSRRGSRSKDRCGMWGLRAPTRCITVPQGASEGRAEGGRLKPTVVRRNRAGQGCRLRRKSLNGSSRPCDGE
jgi:hypothetical protein